jgi:hypothetical protein
MYRVVRWAEPSAEAGTHPPAEHLVTASRFAATPQTPWRGRQTVLQGGRRRITGSISRAPGSSTHTVTAMSEPLESRA